jgi:hypothetical protein
VWKKWRIVIKHGSPSKNRDGLRTLYGYQHLLPIMKYKHWKYQGGLLITSYISMHTRNQKRIKMRMETIISLYGKGNEIISWHSFCVGSFLVLGGNYHCMWCHCWNRLHQICMNLPWQHPQGFENHLWLWRHPLVFVCGGGKGEKRFFVHDSILRCHNCNDILKHIMGYNALIFTWVM